MRCWRRWERVSCRHARPARAAGLRRARLLGLRRRWCGSCSYRRLRCPIRPLSQGSLTCRRWGITPASPAALAACDGCLQLQQPRGVRRQRVRSGSGRCQGGVRHEREPSSPDLRTWPSSRSDAARRYGHDALRGQARVASMTPAARRPCAHQRDPVARAGLRHAARGAGPVADRRDRPTGLPPRRIRRGGRTVQLPAGRRAHPPRERLLSP